METNPEQGFYNRILRKSQDSKKNEMGLVKFDQSLEQRFNQMLKKKAKLAEYYTEIIADPEGIIKFEELISDYRKVIGEQKKHVNPEIIRQTLAEQDLEDYIFELAISTYMRNKEKNELAKAA